MVDIRGESGNNGKLGALKDRVDKAEARKWWAVTFLAGLLAKLDVPVSSQMLVFSTTSLQLRPIRQDNPRALYFNDDIHIGYIPGGKIEVLEKLGETDLYTQMRILCIED